MTHARQMVETNPSRPIVDQDTLVECIEACFDSSQACTACADALLGEGDVPRFVRCIRLDLDCADVCDATGRILSRQTATEPQIVRAALEACVLACRLCAEECEEHARNGMEHCRVCAEACRRCASACTAVLSAMNA